jgi:hypothetical protein
LRELVLRRTLIPARAGSERVYRRAITETPRHDAEVVMRSPATRCPASPAGASPSPSPQETESLQDTEVALA